MLRALGRDDRIAFPDFAIKPLLTGDEIAAIAGIEPARAIGVLKRALLEAELEGRITTRSRREFIQTLLIWCALYVHSADSIRQRHVHLAERRAHVHVRPAGGVVEPRHAREDALVLDVVIAEIRVHLADRHRGGQVADVRARRAHVHLAGAEIGVDAAECAVDVDRAVARVHVDVHAGRQLHGQIDGGVKASRAPALRVRTEPAPHDRFVAVHHDLGGDVVDDLLLFRAAAVSFEVALGRCR